MPNEIRICMACIDDITDYDYEEDTEDEGAASRSVISRYHINQRHKRKQCRRLRREMPYWYNAYYDDSEFWKSVNMLLRPRRHTGWYDKAFVKKLQNARVRYYGASVTKGNFYRKISHRPPAREDKGTSIWE